MTDTSSEAHRHAMEVQTVAKWDRDRRLAHYRGVAKHRGEQAARRLADDVKTYVIEQRGDAPF